MAKSVSPSQLAQRPPMSRPAASFGKFGYSSSDFVTAVSDLGPSSAPSPYVFYMWGPTGPVMEFDDQGNSKAFLFDPMGSCVNTSTTFGLAEKPMLYDGYGLQVWEESTYPDNQRTRRQPFQYKGQAGYYSDIHTGLIYCHNRYYDPRLGRWTSRDPVGLEGGVNVYAYCDGDPVNRVDPTGLLEELLKVKGLSALPAHEGMRRAINGFWGTLSDIGGLILGIRRGSSAHDGSWNKALSDLQGFIFGAHYGELVKEDGRVLQESAIGRKVRSNLPSNPRIGHRVASSKGTAMGTEEAFMWAIREPWNGTQAFVGAVTWQAEYTEYGWRVDVYNKTGLNSFLYHITEKLGIEDHVGGMFGTYWQRYRYYDAPRFKF
jgi:RHS repeat-associated protein